MNDQSLVLQVQYLRQIAEQLRAMGADVPAWLARHGLTPDSLLDPRLVIDLPTFQQLVLDAVSTTQEPALGLLVGERLLVNSHGILGFAAVAASTIRDAVGLFERYIGLRTSMVSMVLHEQGDEAHIQLVETQPLGPVRAVVLEAVVLTIRNVLDVMTAGACPIVRACFPFPQPEPGHVALAEDLFKCPVHHGQSWAGFVLPRDVIDQPLRLADPISFQEATAICQRELDKLTRSETMSTRVRRVLLEKRQGFPSLQVVARLFHMTPRTLHRRLQEEGTTFLHLLEDVRHMLALEHLKSGQLSVQEIAYLLGYSEVANFRRAFKRWEGVSPSTWRPS
jgi:AraC-like DNA-binding protein